MVGRYIPSVSGVKDVRGTMGEEVENEEETLPSDMVVREMRFQHVLDKVP